jgi:hypothetical protein
VGGGTGFCTDSAAMADVKTLVAANATKNHVTKERIVFIVIYVSRAARNF